METKETTSKNRSSRRNWRERSPSESDDKSFESFTIGSTNIRNGSPEASLTSSVNWRKSRPAQSTQSRRITVGSGRIMNETNEPESETRGQYTRAAMSTSSRVRSRGYGHNNRGRQTVLFSVDDNQERSMIFKLEQLAKQSPSEIVLLLADPKNALNEYLQKPFIKNDIIKHLLRLLAVGFSSQMHAESQNLLMGLLLSSSFFKQHLSIFVSSLIAESRDMNTVCKDLSVIFEVLLLRMPLVASEVLKPVLLLCINASDIISKRDAMFDNNLKERLENIHFRVDEILDKAKEMRMKQMQNSAIERAVKPPDDFRQLPIIPTTKEITTDDKPFLRKNIIEGGYEDVEHYLDVQFRLLREDFIAPLRLGICEYLKEYDCNKKRWRVQDVRLYERVKLNSVVCAKERLLYELKFDTIPFRRIKWETSRRLIYGSLLCLSSDNFQTCRFASVINRDVEKLKSGLIEVKLEDENEEGSTLNEEEIKATYTMAESPAYFEAYRHILMSLKRISSKDMPFQQYIVHTSKEHVPPEYLKDHSTIDLSFISDESEYTEDEVVALLQSDESDSDTDESFNRRAIFQRRALRNFHSKINLFSLQEWPRAEVLGLDESQRRAMQLALTSSVAVIQGPPGTGKTFIGLRIVEAILKNFHVTPILVVCFTNHALDQFLEGILQCTDSLVRVGGRSTNESLANYNLRSLLNSRDIRSALSDLTDTRRSIFWRMESIEHDLAAYKGDLKSANSFILHQNSLSNLLEPDRSVLDGIKFSGFYESSLEEEETYITLASWLGLTPDGFVDDYDLFEFLNEEENSSAKSSLNKIETYNNNASVMHIDDKEDAADEDDDVIDIEDEATVEGNQRMLEEIHFLRNHSSRITEVIGRPGCWHLDVTKMDEPYYMYDLEDYKSIKPNDPKFKYVNETVRYILKNYNSLKEQFGLSKVIAERELSRKDIMGDSEVKRIKNLWHLSLGDRWRLYRRWLRLFKQQRRKEIDMMYAEYLELSKQLLDVTNQQYYRVLKNSQVIGMTTTGAAKYQPLLYEIGCKIVIIEEAAEVLESHIVSTLSPQTQHLILIGDHLQLRPKPTVYYLAQKYNLDISLFERLIRNGLPYETLELQHRMRPEISRLIISHIYPQLQDHRSVKNYPSIKGMRSNLYFVSHSQKEEEVDDTMSHLNRFEADFIVNLCRYLMQQGYSPNRITILTMYIGQLLAIRKLMPKSLYEGVTVAAVDNYQGEENDIILLSMVRSNEEGKVGFLKTENRINVALSRARHGLYVVGNFQFLAEHSDLWNRLKADLELSKLMGPSLPIICQNHSESQAIISTGAEFQMFAPEGGCIKKCEVKLFCGHFCPRVCHIDDHGQCNQTCSRCCPEGHPCPLRCYKECDPCLFKVTKILPCGHSAVLPCHLDPEEYQCLEIQERILPHCEHPIKVHCYEDINHVKCKVDCEYRLYCGHKCELKCHPLEDPEHMNIICYKPCARKICKIHDKNCSKDCNEKCSTCDVIIEKTLPCGHKANLECGAERFDCLEPCERILDCGHHCKKKCGQMCEECNELVETSLPCGHTTEIKCYRKSRLFSTVIAVLQSQCKKPCIKLLDCGHTCQKLCHEACTQKCKEIVDVTAVCSHELKIHCYLSKFPAEIISLQCKKPCSQILPCEHECLGTCGECRQGRVHVPCKSKCGRVQICGHSCNIPCAAICPPCNQKCTTRCVHSRCPNKCGFTCKRCKERCEWRCRHYRCNRHCGDICDRPPCDEPCLETLRCGHPCIGLCGEKCPTVCRECHPEKLTELVLSGLEEEPDARFIQLEDCGHCIEVNGLDQWMTMESEKIQMKCCPLCNTTIWQSYRYGNIIRKCNKSIMEVKRKISGKIKNSRLKMQELQSLMKGCRYIRYAFVYEVKKIAIRLNQKHTLNYSECVAIENQILLLEAMAKILNREKPNKDFKSQEDYVSLSISSLSERLLMNEQRISEYELKNINQELHRIDLHASLIDLRKRFSSMASTYVQENLQKLTEIQSIFDSGRALDEEEEDRIAKTLSDMRRAVGLGITEDERVMIVKAMDLKPGAWYKCPNGHIYAIGECGGAMETGYCNECKALIGGGSHRLLDSNVHAKEMDHSRAPAWPITNNMRDYEFI